MTTHISVIYHSLLADDMNLISIPCKEGRQRGPGVIEPKALITSLSFSLGHFSLISADQCFS